MMMVAMIGVILVTSWTISGWKAVREREIRWGFYELRDRLRFAAITNPELCKSEAFWRLDRSLTRYCANIEDISLWLVFPASGLPNTDGDAEEAKFRRDVEANAELLQVYRGSVSRMVEHLRTRHLFLLGWMGSIDWESRSSREDQSERSPEKDPKRRVTRVSEKLISQPMPRPSRGFRGHTVAA